MLQRALRPNDFSLAQRMCWAAGRETTRPEDRAYSLLGLLDMSIDIRYGEGKWSGVQKRGHACIHLLS
jgi:hypothetical protein